MMDKETANEQNEQPALGQHLYFGEDAEQAQAEQPQGEAAGEALPEVTEPGDVIVAATETVEEPETRPANSGRKGGK